MISRSDIAELADQYQSARAPHRAGPRAAEVRSRIDAARRAGAAYAEALGALMPDDLAVAGDTLAAVVGLLSAVDDAVAS